MSIKHGDSKKRLYRIYRCMINRCNNPKDDSYQNYGARGIKICDEWNTYEAFRNWALANGYSDNLSIDRIDNNLGYYPSNCKWSTPLEQGQNQRTNVIIDIDGTSHIFSEWCRIYNIDKDVVWHRIKCGWNIKDALKIPVNYRKKLISYKNETHSLREWSEITGIPLSTIRLRNSKGWSVERMLTQPHEKHSRSKEHQK